MKNKNVNRFILLLKEEISATRINYINQLLNGWYFSKKDIEFDPESNRLNIALSKYSSTRKKDRHIINASLLFCDIKEFSTECKTPGIKADEDDVFVFTQHAISFIKDQNIINLQSKSRKGIKYGIFLKLNNINFQFEHINTSQS